MLACEHGEWVRLSTLALQAGPTRGSLCSVHSHHVTPKMLPLVAHNVAVPLQMSARLCQDIPDIPVACYCVTCIKLGSICREEIGIALWQMFSTAGSGPSKGYSEALLPS